MHAVVMAGGEGTRLRPLTANQPKPMVSVANRPVLERILSLVQTHGIQDAILTLHFMPQVIREYFGDGQEMGLHLSYSIEEEPLGTAGSVKNAETHLFDTFIVMSGDALTDIDLRELIDFHKSKGSLVTIALKKVPEPLEYGIVIAEEDGRIKSFLEKPSWGQVFSDTVNTGIYVLEPSIFDHIPRAQPFDFSKDLFPMLLEAGHPMYGFVTDAYWCDIGDLEQYRQANADVIAGHTKFTPEGLRIREDVWVGEGTKIDEAADIIGPCAIGANAKIESGTRVGPMSVVGDNVVVAHGATLARTVVMDNTFIGSGSTLSACIVGRKCDIRRGARVGERVVIGDECVIGEDAMISHDVKVYPFKHIEPGATVNTSIVWETRAPRTLFGKHGITGLTNIDITPELALRLSVAYGSSQRLDATVVCSRDASRGARMINRSIISGITSTGINVNDLRVTPAPVSRFAVRHTQSTGGVHVRVASFDPQSLQIVFFDENGVDIPQGEQKKIERLFFREEFRRAYHTDIGSIAYSARMVEYYVNGVLRLVDATAIRNRRPRVVMDYAFGGASLIMPHLIGKLRADVLSLNAFNDEEKPTLSPEEVDDSLDSLSRHVQSFGADFGILIDNACEKIILVDERGRKVAPDTLMHLFIELFSRHEETKGKYALPVSISDVAEEIASAHGRKTIPTRMAPYALMEAALRPDVALAASQGGGFIYSRFMPAYDGILAFCKLLEYASKMEEPLGKVIDAFPRYHLMQRVIYCPFDRKGEVMRILIEAYKGHDVQLVDGIKVRHGKHRWVLATPDPEEPVVRVIAEGENTEDARELIHSVTSRISETAEVPRA